MEAKGRFLEAGPGREKQRLGWCSWGEQMQAKSWDN